MFSIHVLVEPDKHQDQHLLCIETLPEFEPYAWVV